MSVIMVNVQIRRINQILLTKHYDTGYLTTQTFKQVQVRLWKNLTATCVVMVNEKYAPPKNYTPLEI